MSERLTLDQLRKTSEFLRLTSKQQLWISTYVENAYDPIFATQTAYHCKNAESARIMSYGLMANPKIIAALNAHFNLDPRAEFLRELDRAIVDKKFTPAQFKALQLKAQVLGYIKQVEEDPLENVRAGKAVQPATPKFAF